MIFTARKPSSTTRRNRVQVVSISMRYGLASRQCNPVRLTLKEPSGLMVRRSSPLNLVVKPGSKDSFFIGNELRITQGEQPEVAARKPLTHVRGSEDSGRY